MILSSGDKLVDGVSYDEAYELAKTTDAREAYLFNDGFELQASLKVKYHLVEKDLQVKLTGWEGEDFITMHAELQKKYPAPPSNNIEGYPNYAGTVHREEWRKYEG